MPFIKSTLIDLIMELSRTKEESVLHTDLELAFGI